MLKFGRLKPVQNEPNAPELVQSGSQNVSKIHQNPNVAPQLVFLLTLGRLEPQNVDSMAKSEPPDCKMNSPNKKKGSSDS